MTPSGNIIARGTDNQDRVDRMIPILLLNVLFLFTYLILILVILSISLPAFSIILVPMVLGYGFIMNYYINT